MSTETELATAAEDTPAAGKNGSSLMSMLAWFSVGIAVAAVGIFVGAELRSRYRFRRRTPYDFYANAGEARASEFGVGI